MTPILCRLQVSYWPYWSAFFSGFSSEWSCFWPFTASDTGRKCFFSHRVQASRPGRLTLLTRDLEKSVILGLALRNGLKVKLATLKPLILGRIWTAVTSAVCTCLSQWCKLVFDRKIVGRKIKDYNRMDLSIFFVKTRATTNCWVCQTLPFVLITLRFLPDIGLCDFVNQFQTKTISSFIQLSPHLNVICYRRNRQSLYDKPCVVDRRI